MNPAPKIACELMVSAAYVVPVVPTGVVLRDHSLIVERGGIVDLLPTSDAEPRYHPAQRIERPHHVLLPGFVNAHGHSPMTLLRGYADDLPLGVWLGEHIWPAEAKWVGPEFARLGSELALLEMSASGTTCFSDMYFFVDQTAEATLQAGLRGALGLILIDFPSAWARRPEEYLAKGREVLSHYRGRGHLEFLWAPHSPYATSNETLELLSRQLARDKLRVQLHVDEARDEARESRREHGHTQVERLSRLGLLDDHLIAAHFVHPEPEEVSRLARAGAHVAHCPESNAKLASGMAAVAELRAAGVNVALGTDGAASNNNLDMVEEMRSAAFIGKLRGSDAAALSATCVLEMATLGGARALGLDSRIGSLELGKRADMTCVDLRQESTWPVTDPISQLVYGASGQQVTDTWVEGRAVYLDGRHQTLDRERIFDEAQSLRERIEKAHERPIDRPS